MTPGFGHPADAGYDACATYFSFSSILSKISCADGCLHRFTSASRHLGIPAFFLGIQIMSLMLNLLRRNQELTIGVRCTAHGVRCGVAPTRGVGSSSRTSKMPQRVQSYREMLYVTLFRKKLLDGLPIILREPSVRDQFNNLREESVPIVSA